ncbi:DUF4174 domain-containing protein [Rudanella paleaurantiibacter]|uniref:DUF4174 domain-containing protein n=1 Tax=Rudanella paleaurantiibacter TaxID=2614655 RepID=A0A7J5TUL9_9BACT|nr:DUF4174 domain-containing protein [Rudanella paleaurantiibacter]KAB7727603.1 DUF4174 domain-containing protein [Rudanella paleaurantiibacter]
MRQLLLLSMLLLPIDAQPAEPTLRQWLAERQWKNRIVLLYAPSANTPELRQQRQLFSADRPGLDERDLLVRELTADNLSATDRAYLSRTLDVPETGFQALLIGKDGGVKLRQSSPFTLKQLFSTIDGMYMRQQEMKKSRR